MNQDTPAPCCSKLNTCGDGGLRYQAETGPTPCCGNFDTCTKACTPRGAHLQMNGLPLHHDDATQKPPVFIECISNTEAHIRHQARLANKNAKSPEYRPEDVAFNKVDPIHAMTVEGYSPLASVLRRAYAQAASGKGAERHANGQPFDQQPMQQLIALHGLGFATGQAGKKSQEALRLPRDRAVAELLGAINYLAGAVIALERQPETD